MIKTSKGLWAMLQEQPYKLSTLVPLTKEIFENCLNELNKPRKFIEPEFPAFYLLMCNDEEFIDIYKSKKHQKFGMCGLETYNKIQERVDKLIKIE